MGWNSSSQVYVQTLFLDILSDTIGDHMAPRAISSTYFGTDLTGAERLELGVYVYDIYTIRPHPLPCGLKGGSFTEGAHRLHNTPSADNSRIIAIRRKKALQGGIHGHSRSIAIISRRKKALERVDPLYEGELYSNGENGAQQLCFMNKSWRVENPDSSVDLVRKAHHHLYPLHRRCIARVWGFVGVTNAEE